MVNMELYNTEEIKQTYLELYMKMMKEGILSLEEEEALQKARKIPGLVYSLCAFVDSVDGSTCFQMYCAFEDRIIELYSRSLFLLFKDLAKQFFIDSNTHFEFFHYYYSLNEQVDQLRRVVEKDITKFVDERIDFYLNR